HAEEAGGLVEDDCVLDQVEAVESLRGQAIAPQELLAQRRLRREELQPILVVALQGEPHPAVTEVAGAVIDHDRMAARQACQRRIETGPAAIWLGLLLRARHAFALAHPRAVLARKPRGRMRCATRNGLGKRL